ncbi:hypothetical protein [Neodiprion sertifer nucleopolyhedrovirus]|uniref:Uncharacterized protein n=1 Tax=Neodiprion sertifer nucleopolyhedrovirus TaxID=111874 RepID=Q6JKD4_9CBAC|nr:hypothetical protein NeseNPV_gp26 [Neodiprion sertifer nucleopolyhedrovirus]AAQ96403.1 hypothetical protein [Neodiprion sertifer nucleopolyhedrovirus]
MLLIAIIMILLFIGLIYAIYLNNQSNSNAQEIVDNVIEKTINVNENGDFSLKLQPFVEIIPTFYKGMIYNTTSACDYTVILCDEILSLEKIIRYVTNNSLINNNTICMFRTAEEKRRNLSLHTLQIEVFANGIVLVHNGFNKFEFFDKPIGFARKSFNFAFVDNTDANEMYKLTSSDGPTVVLYNNDFDQRYLLDNGFISENFNLMLYQCKIMYKKIE